MSYQIGIDTIHLRPTPRLAHTEYCSNAALRRAVDASLVGAAAGGGERPAVGASVGGTFDDAWQLDFIWSTNDGPVPWHLRGRTTTWATPTFLEGGTDRRDPKPSPFECAEDVLAFDAVKEYGLPDFDELVAYYERTYQQTQQQRPNQVFPGGYYKTIVSGAIDAFGWDMLLEAAADRDGFERVLDSIFQLSLHHYRAWANTSIEVFICHDDMVWSEGPFMHPDVYRKVIFPRYRQLWAVLRSAGKKVLYCSDGDFTMFIDDLADAGADGFIFEPLTDLDTVVQRYGRTHVIVGSKVDCRTLTFGTHDDIRREIDATLPLAMECPGFIFAVGNHIPSNVPVDNALFYFDYLSSHWDR